MFELSTGEINSFWVEEKDGGVRARVAPERTLIGDSDWNWSVDFIELQSFQSWIPAFREVIEFSKQEKWIMKN